MNSTTLQEFESFVGNMEAKCDKMSHGGFEERIQKVKDELQEMHDCHLEDLVKITDEFYLKVKSLKGQYGSRCEHLESQLAELSRLKSLDKGDI